MEDIKTWQFETMTPEDEAIIAQFADATETGGGASDPSAIGHAAHTHQFNDVINAIQTGTNPAIDGHEGRRSVEIILAIYKAAETGSSIQFPLAGDPELKARG